MYLLYLVGLQEITGFSEVGFECFWLQLCLDGCAMLGIHLFFGGDLQVQKTPSDMHIHKDKEYVTSIKH